MTHTSTCPTCGGTILARARAGAPRGSCHCPDNKRQRDLDYVPVVTKMWIRIGVGSFHAERVRIERELMNHLPDLDTVAIESGGGHLSVTTTQTVQQRRVAAAQYDPVNIAVRCFGRSRILQFKFGSPSL